MRAIQCEELGAGTALAVRDVPMPEPGPGEVRIKVTAAGVNFADLLMIAGRYQERVAPPFTPGLEVAGTLDRLGDGVEGFRLGERVLAPVDRGGWAEWAIARGDDLVPLPDALDDATAAGFAIAYGTAYGALVWRAGLQPGERLLVHGAAGGVGLTSVECGKALGAHVVATARGEARTAIALAHGADAAIDSDHPDLEARLREAAGPRGFDVVVDPVGGRLFDASLRTIGWEGRLLLVGFASGEIPQIPANRLLVKNAAALGFYWGSYRRRDPARLRAAFPELFRWLAEGRLRPHVSHTLPLERASEALALLRERRSTGKVVLRP